ncbi:unnamed protein product [Gadus morhua 'NCC']
MVDVQVLVVALEEELVVELVVEVVVQLELVVVVVVMEEEVVVDLVVVVVVQLLVVVEVVEEEVVLVVEVVMVVEEEVVVVVVVVVVEEVVLVVVVVVVEEVVVVVVVEEQNMEVQNLLVGNLHPELRRGEWRGEGRRSKMNMMMAFKSWARTSRLVQQDQDLQTQQVHTVQRPLYREGESRRPPHRRPMGTRPRPCVTASLNNLLVTIHTPRRPRQPPQPPPNLARRASQNTPTAVLEKRYVLIQLRFTLKKQQTLAHLQDTADNGRPDGAD